ncbi:MAG: M50 family metallopeptidase [Mycobacteriales bacterium]
MIFHLRQPVVVLAMALGFVIAVLVHNLAQAAVGRMIGDPVVRMGRRRVLDPKREFEPFGIIAFVIGGVGWGSQVPLSEPRNRGRKGRFLTALAAGPVADVVVGAGCVAAYGALTDGLPLFAPRAQVIPIASSGYAILGIVGLMCLAMGLLHVIPLPPLDGARVLWALAPPTPGWQKARYNLEEQNYGLGALVILSLPVFAGEGLVVQIAYAMAEPLRDVILGLF